MAPLANARASTTMCASDEFRSRYIPKGQFRSRYIPGTRYDEMLLLPRITSTSTSKGGSRSAAKLVRRSERSGGSAFPPVITPAAPPAARAWRCAAPSRRAAFPTWIQAQPRTRAAPTHAAWPILLRRGGGTNTYVFVLAGVWQTPNQNNIERYTRSDPMTYCVQNVLIGRLPNAR